MTAMTPAQARELNSLAYVLARLCRRYGAADGITALALNISRMTDDAVDGLASVQPKEESE